VLPYSHTKRITVFKTAYGRAVPVGREEMDVRSGRVSSTYALRGRRSRRSKISSSGEEEGWLGTTTLGVVGLAATVLTLAAAFFFDFPAADLGAAVDVCSGFLGLAVFLVAATLGCSGAFVTG
jgi:uncharacterized membrane protein YeaQ/YmgE (transglycosylase-associated protein family)